jgi:tRNA pseudouridine55 synthase
VAVKKLLQVKGKGFGVEGILDPFASGLLIAATGPSTRFLSYFLKFQKTYTAEITLGAETDTLDPTGEVTRREAIPSLTTELLTQIQAQFTGEIQQIPPLYSNLKIDGRRGHEIARGGETAELKPRWVAVHEMLLAIKDETTLTMRCTVSSGTYIRSLARDIAYALGTCGHLNALRRVAIGPFSVAELAPLEPEPLGWIKAEMGDFDALHFFPVVTINAIEADKLLHGNPFRLPNPGSGISRVLCGGQFIGLGLWDIDKLLVEKIYSTEPEP